MDNFLMEYDNLKKLSIRKMLSTLMEIEGKKLKDLKLKDLTYHNSKPIWPGEGVYIFRYAKKIIYVGKVRSMSFTERIGKHFDLRYFSWFNRLLELICNKKLHLTWNNKNAKKASLYAFKNLDIILINFKKRKRIDRIERLLRSCTDTLNKFKNLKESDLDKIVNLY